MFNTRDILMIASGAVLGGGVVAAAGYFGVIRRYIPLREIESELDDVRREYLEYTSKLKVLKHESEAADDVEVEEHHDESQDGEQANRVNYSGIPQQHRDIPEHSELESEEPEGTDEEPVAEWDPWINGYYDPLTMVDGRYTIDEGNPRWDGPLNDDETTAYTLAVQEASECMSGAPEIVDGVILDIKEARFTASINEDEPSYLISYDDHLSKPDFIETQELDYYEEDDILAEGRNIIGQIENMINPIVLNHFNSTSQSGDPNVVWCRNDIHCVDYEITRHECSYQQAVLGIGEKSVYRPPRKFNREIAADMEETNAKHSSSS